ncbi:MAG: hypothetical protein HFI64_13185 [Lachnospiraceae bacterium]|nr:hypothetical protein [Lachnospiraceae bacterium]
MQVRVLLSAGKGAEILGFAWVSASFAWNEKGVLEGPEYDFDSNVDSNRRKSMIQERSYTCDICGVIGKYGMEKRI